MSFGADILIGGPDRQEQPTVVRCTIVIAPATRTDTIGVVPIGGSSDQLYEIPSSNWEPLWDASLPSVGAACVVVFDHYGDPWLVGCESAGSWPPQPEGGINVKDYGATGDGVTDDTPAVVDAIAALSTHGGMLFFPPGKYNLTGLNFDGTTSVVLKGAGGNTPGRQPATVLNLTGASSNISARSSFGFTIEDLMVQQTSGSFTGHVVDLSLLTASASAFAQLSRVSIYGNASAATSLLNLDHVISSTFQNSVFYGGVSNVQGSSSLGQSNAFAFIGCSFNAATTQQVLNPGQGWAFHGCTFENLAGGSACAIRGPAQGLSVTGCWTGDSTGGTAFDLTGGSGVFLGGNSIGATGGTGVNLASGYVGATIVGNKFTHETTGVNFTDTGSNCLVWGNDFTSGLVTTPVAYTTIPTDSLIQSTTTGGQGRFNGALFVGSTNVTTAAAGSVYAQTRFAVAPTDPNHWVGRLSASGTGVGSYLKIECGDDLALRGIQVGAGSTNQLGFYGTTPVSRPARPVTLTDVINALVALGLTA